MTIDYQQIINQFAQIIGVCLPMGLTLGLCEKMVTFVLDAALDRLSNRRRNIDV